MEPLLRAERVLLSTCILRGASTNHAVARWDNMIALLPASGGAHVTIVYSLGGGGGGSSIVLSNTW